MIKCYLKKICLEKGMTIQQLADKLDMPAQQLHKYDSDIMDISMPNVGLAIRIAKALEVNVEDVWII